MQFPIHTPIPHPPSPIPTPHNNSFLLTAFVTALIAVTASVWGQIINEDVKLMASDGYSNAYMGETIAIDNGIVAIGAYGNKDFGYNSGTAYLFDAVTGSQLFKLSPGDGVEWGYFGYSIDIDNGIVVVGAYGDDDNGSGSGSVYLFDADTGLQTAKLLPDDGMDLDYFGISVAIDNGIIAVGAFNDEANGYNSGSDLTHTWWTHIT